jgi:hypothetical protein
MVRMFADMAQRKLSQVVMLLTCICEVSGLNTGWDASANDDTANLSVSGAESYNAAVIRLHGMLLKQVQGHYCKRR